jgi:hypothetical protein
MDDLNTIGVEDVPAVPAARFPAVRSDPQVTEEAPPSADSTQAAAPADSTASSRNALLEEILHELRAGRRESQHRDFSLAHLAGAIAQAFAVCAIGWGLYAVMNDDAHNATIRLLAGIAFQLIALTWFASSRR